MKRDFPNLKFRTYQSFVNLSRKEIKAISVDILIVDEFHHIAAPVASFKATIFSPLL